MDSEYVEMFFGAGAIRLGSMDFYRKHEDAETGDPKEGDVILVGVGSSRTEYAEVTAGLDGWMLCASLTKDAMNPPPIRRSAAFIISDPHGFATAVAKAVGAIGYKFGKCWYGDKVIVDSLPSGYSLSDNDVDRKLFDIASLAKYFIKGPSYARQSEFRFFWQMGERVSGTLDIVVPDAIKFCLPLK